MRAAELQAAGKEIIFTNGACWVSQPGPPPPSALCCTALSRLPCTATCILPVLSVCVWLLLFALCIAPQSGTPTSWVPSPSPSHARCAHHTLLASLPCTPHASPLCSHLHSCHSACIPSLLTVAITYLPARLPPATSAVQCGAVCTLGCQQRSAHTSLHGLSAAHCHSLHSPTPATTRSFPATTPCVCYHSLRLQHTRRSLRWRPLPSCWITPRWARSLHQTPSSAHASWSSPSTEGWEHTRCAAATAAAAAAPAAAAALWPLLLLG